MLDLGWLTEQSTSIISSTLSCLAVPSPGKILWELPTGNNILTLVKIVVLNLAESQQPTTGPSLPVACIWFNRQHLWQLSEHRLWDLVWPSTELWLCRYHLLCGWSKSYLHPVINICQSCQLRCCNENHIYQQLPQYSHQQLIIYFAFISERWHLDDRFLCCVWEDDWKWLYHPGWSDCLKCIIIFEFNQFLMTMPNIISLFMYRTCLVL